MASYRVKWEVDVDAESHEAAALAAREMQLDRYSSATIFNVELDAVGSFPRTIDLDELMPN